MNYSVLGTGVVGRVVASKLATNGHDVMIGTRNIQNTLARRETDAMGNRPYAEWQKDYPSIQLGTFEQAIQHSSIIFNATSGTASLQVLEQAGTENLAGKILVDIANPLDFSNGMPPTLSIVNTDSLGEQIQAAFPDLKVVKALNTMNANLMVEPSLLNKSHDVFVSGNDNEAKTTVTELLKSEFGWQSVIDLGDISTARGTEMLLPIWLRLWGALGTPMFNFKIVTG